MVVLRSAAAEGGLLLEGPAGLEAACAVLGQGTVPLVDQCVQPVGAGRGLAQAVAEVDADRSAGVEADRLAVGDPPQPQQNVAVRMAVLHIQQVVAPQSTQVLPRRAAGCGREDAEEEIAGGPAVVVVDDHQVAHFH